MFVCNCGVNCSGTGQVIPIYLLVPYAKSEFVSVLHVASNFSRRLILQTIVDGVAHNPEGVLRVPPESGIDAQ